MKPLFPYTKMYGCKATTPPDTDTLLLIVRVDAPLVVAAADITKVVALVTDITVVADGIPVPLTDCPAPICAVDATVTTVDVANVAAIVNTPIADRVVPDIDPISTGVLTVLAIALRSWPG
jgi:hypothetical protein